MNSGNPILIPIYFNHLALKMELTDICWDDEEVEGRCEKYQ